MTTELASTADVVNGLSLRWLAGFLEGEGWFSVGRDRKRHSFDIKVGVAQKQRWPLDKISAALGGSVTQYKTRSPKASFATSPMHVWVTTGAKAVGLMMTLYGLLSPKRQARIRELLAEWRTRPVAERYRVVCPRGHPYDLIRRHVKRKNGKLENWTSRWCRVCKAADAATRRAANVHCPRGHPYDATRRNGARLCTQCVRMPDQGELCKRGHPFGDRRDSKGRRLCVTCRREGSTRRERHNLATIKTDPERLARFREAKRQRWQSWYKRNHVSLAKRRDRSRQLAAEEAQGTLLVS